MKKLLIITALLIAALSVQAQQSTTNYSGIGALRFKLRTDADAQGHAFTNLDHISFSDGTYLSSTSTPFTALVDATNAQQRCTTLESTISAATVTGTLPVATISNSIINKAFWKALPTSTNTLVSGQLWISNNFITIFP